MPNSPPQILNEILSTSFHFKVKSDHAGNEVVLKYLPHISKQLMLLNLKCLYI